MPKLRHRAAGILGYLPLMHGARATTVDSGIAKGSWSELFRDGRGLYSALVIGGIAMNATARDPIVPMALDQQFRTLMTDA